MTVLPMPLPMIEMPLVVETLLDQLQLPAGMRTTSPSAAREIAASTSAFEQVEAVCVAAFVKGATTNIASATKEIRFMYSLQRFASDPSAPATLTEPRDMTRRLKLASPAPFPQGDGDCREFPWD
jgi:hypothetical protein